MKLGDTVTWRARHFGIAFRITSAITEYQYPSRFVDEQLHGPFRRWWHDSAIASAIPARPLFLRPQQVNRGRCRRGQRLPSPAPARVGASPQGHDDARTPRTRHHPGRGKRAENDWLVAPPKDLTTARAYHTTAQTLPAGHDMMRDTAWEQAAIAIQTVIASQLAPR